MEVRHKQHTPVQAQVLVRADTCNIWTWNLLWSGLR
jgi:hypothetical protein